LVPPQVTQMSETLITNLMRVHMRFLPYCCFADGIDAAKTSRGYFLDVAQWQQPATLHDLGQRPRIRSVLV
jgi:hypothetical protein